jgi:Tfp pilus assembly protein PilV
MAAKNRHKNSRLKNQQGTAMVETLPLLIIFVIMLAFGLGFFSVVHTAIMNSMAARAYAFETFRNRADLNIHRENDASNPATYYSLYGARFHAINSENLGNQQGQFASVRNIQFGVTPQQTSGNVTDHNTNIYTIGSRNRKGGVETSPAWVMVGYGICINAQCGDQ